MKKQLAVVVCLCSLLFFALIGYNVSRAKINDVQLELPETVTAGEQVLCSYTISAEMVSTTYTREFNPQPSEGETEGADTDTDTENALAWYAGRQMEGWQVQWASSDEEVATIDESGIITAVGSGTAQITVTVEDKAGTIIQKKVILIVTVPVEKIVAPESLQIEIGGSIELQVETEPESASAIKLAFTSADESVATVDESGKITGVAIGTTTITVTSVDDPIRGTPPSIQVEVEVGISPEQVNLDRQNLSLRAGAATQLNVTVAPDNITFPYSFEWTTSNAAVATVNTNGRVTGVKAGTASITVTIAGTQIFATCTVTVTAPPPTASGASGNMQELLNLVNAARAQAGVPPLALSSELNNAASTRAGELVSLFSHTRPNGTEWHTVSGSARGENIAYGHGSVQAVFDGWMGSDGHRANILNPSYTIMGGGSYSSGGTYYWCQLFG